MSSGVYIVTNKINGRRYIGYSENLEYRFEANNRELQKGSFGQDFQQFIDDYQQFGEEAFISGILEITPNERSLMQQRAEKWKDIIQPEYNSRNKRDRHRVRL